MPAPAEPEPAPAPAPLFREEAVAHHARGNAHGDVLRVAGAVASRRRAIPFIAQLTIAECGAACLAMNLAYHGKDVGLEAVREVLGPGRDGLSAFDLLRAASAFGQEGRGVKIEVEDLAHVDRGTILHWGFAHFVVFDRVRRGGIDILDPMIGRRRIPFDEVRRSFTGVALLLEPGAAFVPEARGGRGAWAYARTLMTASRGLLLSVLTISIVLQVFALAMPLLTGAIVDRVVPDHARTIAPMLTLGLVGLVVFQLVSSLGRARLLIALRTRLDLKMTIGFLDHLIALPYAFFQIRSTGDLMQRWGSNAHIREVLTSGTLSAAIDGALVALYLVLLVVYSPSLGLLVLGLGALQLVIFQLSRRPKRELLAREMVEEVRSQGYQLELLAGMETLKSLGAERGAAEHWSKLFVNVLNASVARSRFDATIDVLISTVRFASPLVILLYGASQVIAGELSLGRMLALSALAAGFLNPLATLVSTLMQFQLLGTYLERLDDVFRAKPEQDPARATIAPRLTGQVALDDVAFRFSPTAPLVVDGVTVTLAAGQLVGVVGRSGAGKSTLAAILAGMYRPERGRVMFDGLDLADLDLRSVRAQLGMVTQNPYLFAATIRANIAIARPGATLAEIEAAARRAQIHDEIARMPMGYDTLLVDRGASLSGGQRQRVALARALLADPAILILDEATSALDSLTERSVAVALAELRCTRVVIAHRMSTVVEADRILVLDGGVLVAHGTHAELLAAGGLYAQLVEGLA